MDETDLDIVDILNVVIPGEKHLPGMRYCGPGTRLDLRLDEGGNPLPGNEPKDRVDEEPSSMTWHIANMMIFDTEIKQIRKWFIVY